MKVAMQYTPKKLHQNFDDGIFTPQWPNKSCFSLRIYTEWEVNESNPDSSYYAALINEIEDIQTERGALHLHCNIGELSFCHVIAHGIISGYTEKHYHPKHPISLVHTALFL